MVGLQIKQVYNNSSLFYCYNSLNTIAIGPMFEFVFIIANACGGKE